MIEARIEYKPILNALRQAAAQMNDKRPLMRSVAGVMFRAAEDNFEQEGRPKWQDLHPGTKLARTKQGTWPGKILQRSGGGLAASIVQRFDSNNAVVGSNKVYAAIHQGLSPLARGNPDKLPARKSWLGPIPARAGEPRPYAFGIDRRAAYPRSRGGTWFCPCAAFPERGLSPLARGNQVKK